MMATDANKNLLKDAGMLTDEVAAAGANDLAVVIEATSTELAEEVISKAREMVEEAAEREGADAISAINTVQGLIGIDLENMEPLPSVRGISSFGVISGP
ncbi:MAG: hypothetical protein QW835_06120, partial [Candidatus Hadarchaeum sp.]